MDRLVRRGPGDLGRPLLWPGGDFGRLLRGAGDSGLLFRPRIKRGLVLMPS